MWNLKIHTQFYLSSTKTLDPSFNILKSMMELGHQEISRKSSSNVNIMNHCSGCPNSCISSTNKEKFQKYKENKEKSNGHHFWWLSLPHSTQNLQLHRKGSWPQRLLHRQSEHRNQHWITHWVHHWPVPSRIQSRPDHENCRINQLRIPWNWGKP